MSLPYVSSKLTHRQMWLGLNLATLSSWIEQAEITGASNLDQMWQRYFQELADCSRLILYVEPGEVLKGALIELGAALANGKLVTIVWEGSVEDLEKIIGTVVHHKLVSVVDCIGNI